MEIVEAITKLYKIFKENNWILKDTDEYVFNNFCILFENLTSIQRVLLIELTEKYSWISFSDYQISILKSMNSIDEKELSVIKTIYFFPIIKMTDEKKVKSGHTFIYIIKGLKGLLVKYKHIKFKILTSFEELQEFELKDDSRLFLVDDYLGSGETVENCLEEICKNPKLELSKFKIICMACQDEIYQILKKKGVSIHYDMILKKGISDYNSSPQLEIKKQIMLDIEAIIPGGSLFSFGYNKSEALITLLRTPDNTFPIFWKKHRKDGKYYDAPFSREEIFEL